MRAHALYRGQIAIARMPAQTRAGQKPCTVQSPSSPRAVAKAVRAARWYGLVSTPDLIRLLSSPSIKDLFGCEATLERVHTMAFSDSQSRTPREAAGDDGTFDAEQNR